MIKIKYVLANSVIQYNTKNHSDSNRVMNPRVGLAAENVTFESGDNDNYQVQCKIRQVT